MQEFNLHWDDYATGFGAPDTEYWIGNEALHKLTSHANMSLRIEFEDIYSKSWYAEYDTFTVSSAEDGYRLNIGDRDNDLSNSNCASNYEGGWWFSHCLHVNLNGKFNLGLTWFHADKNEWIAVASSQMKIRRRQS
ncbi:hypothetical protein WDU94_001693 [Cyamophila willieti]